MNPNPMMLDDLMALPITNTEHHPSDESDAQVRVVVVFDFLPNASHHSHVYR
jgi:hypothetical protein